MEHAFLKMYQQSNLIADICMPHLERLNINHFFVIELDKEGNFLLFDSSADLYSDYISSGIINQIPKNILKTYSLTGTYATNMDKILQDLQVDNLKLFEQYHFTDSLRLVEVKNTKQVQSILIFGFDANKQRIQDNYLLNCQPQCALFAEFFKKRFIKVNTVKKHACDNKNLKAQLNYWFKNYHEHDVLINQFNTDLNKQTKKNTEVFKSCRLTHKEWVLLEYYSQNYTSKATAQQLGLSKRTIDRHFENMRIKLNCFSKEDILIKCRALGLIK